MRLWKRTAVLAVLAPGVLFVLSQEDHTQELVFPFGETGGAVLRPKEELDVDAPFSLCLWMKASIQTSFAKMLVSFIANSTIFLSRSGTMVALRTEFQLLDALDPPMTPRVWHHLCVVRHSHVRFQLFLDGLSFSSSPYPTNDTEVNERRSRNMRALMAMKKSALSHADGRNDTQTSIIILGALESPYDIPVGRMADLRVFSHAVTLKDVNVLRECSPDSPRDVGLELLYVTPAMSIRNVTYARVCQPERFHVITYTEYISHKDAASLCGKLGGSLPNPQDFTDLRLMTEIFPRYSRKKAMYLWLSNSTNTTALGIMEDWCPVLNIQYGGSLPMAAPCDTWARDFVCLVPHGEALSLLYRQDEVTLFYGEEGDNFLMISESGLSLIHRNGTYMIKNYMGTNLGSRIGSQISSALGLRQWETFGGDVEYITISTCLSEEFTCRNGDCVALRKRCDKLPDCDDASDEDDCRYLLEPPATYRSYVSPSDNTPVGLNVSVSNIHDINMKENQIGITAEIRLNWTDSRLTFTNMFGKIRLDEVIGKIWHPNIVLIGAKYENNVKLRKGIDDLRFLYGESSTNGTQVVVNSSRALMSRGKDIDLQLLLILDLSISCSYNLTLYPFDVQRCALKLALEPDLSGATRWNEHHLHVTGALPQAALYTISHVLLLHYARDEVHVQFLLERHFGSYMLTSYLPCLILLVIGSTTLVYPVSAESDRVMVTLSCLIVLASLLAQASATLPESASSKAIEVWFFYTIARMFLVSVVHTAVYRANHQTCFLRVSCAPPRPKVKAAAPAAAREAALRQTRASGRRWSPESITKAGLVLGLVLDMTFLACYVSYIAFTRRSIIESRA